MRTAAALLLLLALPLPALAQRRVDERRAAAPDVSLRVYVPNGQIRIMGWDRDSVAVTGTVAAGAEAGFHLGGGFKGMKMFVDGDDGRGETPPADLLLRVPTRATVWVKSAGAGIHVSGVTGPLDLYSVGGKIRVAGNPRQVSAESMAGDVSVQVNTPSLRARSANGNIAIGGQIEEATASTVSGHVVVPNGRIRLGRLESVTGDIRFEADLAPTSALIFQNHGGTIDLRLPADLAADFTIMSFQGELRSEFGNVRLPAGSVRNRELTFSTGAGGAQITARTFSGSVLLTKRMPTAPVLAK